LRVSRRVPASWRWRWHRTRHHGRLLAAEGPSYYARWLADRWLVWVRARLASRRYTTLTVGAVEARRRSETVFVFGSGYSLNDLQPAEWAHVAEHDVFGFSGFIYQRWVRTDFHLIRGWDESADGLARLHRTTEAYGRRLALNPLFREATVVLQSELSAHFANTLVARGLLPSGIPLLRYRTARCLDDRPSDAWSAGLSHGPGTLGDVVNAAYLLGWRHIVLIGVDMYDSRYFWGPPDATLGFGEDGEFTRPTPLNDHGIAWNTRVNTARNGMVDTLGRWAALLSERGVRISVYNPRSLLTCALPVYDGVQRGVPAG
jgi:hypothetical protein